MAVIQISKIQLRRGLKLELPGQPTVPGDASTLTQGLDVGELGFTTDSGQLFIGADPSFYATESRISFPYQNIEVLTEWSPSIRAVLPQEATLTAGTTTAASTGITLPTSVDGAISGNGAIIPYTLVEKNTTNVWQGELRLATDGSSNTIITDVYVSVGTDPVRSDIVFTVDLNSPTSFRIDFVNQRPNDVVMSYRVM